MTRKVSRSVRSRSKLTREAVIQKAVELADREGVEALSMRKLASELGVEAMSLYNHVSSKEQLVAGMAELVWQRVYVPNVEGPWYDELRLRYLTAHSLILAHPWVPKAIESCRVGPLLLAAANAVLGCMRNAGFPLHLAYRALLVLDSYLYGFAFQETSWPHARSELPQVVTEMLPEVPTQQFPHLVELMEYVARVSAHVPPEAKGFTQYRAEFEFGLDLVLSGFGRAVARDCGQNIGALGDARHESPLRKER